MGGTSSNHFPEQTLAENYIDAVVIGEGEYTFKKLLEHFLGKKTPLEGVGIKLNGKINILPASKKSVNLDSLPLPAWDLLEDVDRYFPNKKHNALPISTTRGCAFKCGFCHNSNENVKKYLGCYRIANPQRAIEEYKMVQKLTKNKIDIIDVGEDLHLVSEDYAKRFCDTIVNSGLNLKWSTAARYQTLNEEIVKMIARSGCIKILLGVESGSKRIQEMNNKIVDLDKAKKIAKLLRKNGIFVTNSYILGHPTETLGEMNRTLKFIKEIPADENLIQLYRPMPGTPYFKICSEKEKINLPDRLAGWAGFGVLGQDVNVSEIPKSILFSTYFKTNAIEQTKFWFNQQRFFVRHGLFEDFAKSFIYNRFTFKLREYLNLRKK